MSTGVTESSSALAQLFNAVKQTREVNYFAMSAIAFVIYDIIVTASKEVQLIWNDRWSTAKALYFFARYYGLIYLTVVFAVSNTPAHLLSGDFCRRYFHFYSLCGDILFTTVVNVILMLRLMALYKYDRKVIVFLVVILVAEFTVELYVTIWSLRETVKTAYVSPPGIPIGGCLAENPHIRTTLMSWIPCLTLSVILFLMTLIRVARSTSVVINNTSMLSVPRALFKTEVVSPLLAALLRDGAVHFFCITAILLVCTVTTTVVKGPFAAVGLDWLVAIYSVSGSRLILNLRDVAHQESNVHTDAALPLQTFRVCSGSTGDESYGSITF